MTQKYVLTGGPGSGKSSILLALEKQGEYIIREAAEDHIKLRQSQGCKQPWMEEDFQERILDLQLQREDSIPENIGRVFIDRGVYDGLAYTKEESCVSNRIMMTGRIYAKIFLIENLRFTENTRVRRENQNEAIKLGNSLQEIYTNLGYKPIRIHSGTVDERFDLILSHF